jgi:aryl-alcohol dehydrogenase-like predicted oxidoreductase
MSLLPLVLGTAQLGLDYGVANRSGKPGLKKAGEIVSLAWAQGIRFFDTAQAYGESETVLGHCLAALADSEGEENLRVVTKLHPEVDPLDGGAVLAAVEASVKRIKVKSLWGFLLHREGLLEKGAESLRKVADLLKKERMIQFFGISVYTPEKAIVALNTDGIDLVQLPFNILDQRALRWGIFDLAKERNKIVFIRSVYLQGLLLIDPEHLPIGMSFAKDALMRFHRAARDCCISPKLLALSYVVLRARGALLVIGAEEPFQAKENVNLYRQAEGLALPDLGFLSEEDPKLINPALWPRATCS